MGPCSTQIFEGEIPIKDIIKARYGITCKDIIPQEGGWSALAFKAYSAEGNYFFKVYEKKNVSTEFWTARIGDYMPILVWLNQTPLSGKIVKPILTLEGDYKWEDQDCIYLLFEYIDGQTVCRDRLTDGEVRELAEIMGNLHAFGAEIPFVTCAIREDFALPFCDGLEVHGKDAARMPEAVRPYLNKLLEKSTELRMMAEKVKGEKVNMRLCHTDAHGWNLMRGNNLILIDWEGLRLAPVEADLFMFFHKPWWKLFEERYRQIRPEFAMNKDMLGFYMLRRKLEDIWADLERILFDDLPDEEYREEVGRVVIGCAQIGENLVI